MILVSRRQFLTFEMDDLERLKSNRDPINNQKCNVNVKCEVQGGVRKMRRMKVVRGAM